MAALTSVAVTARTTSGCTITFNAAAIDCTAAQLVQLHHLLNRLLVDTYERPGGTPAIITIGAQG